jgi:hypothetical protein
MSDAEGHSPGIFATTAAEQGDGVGAETWGLCLNALDKLFPNADGYTSISFAMPVVRVSKTKTLKRTSLAVISVVQRLNFEI